ncbi:MAG: NAD-dependent epimerase/dehydratase family protein [Acidobacteriaceae bacterium]
MPVVVTGASGFLGGRLAQILAAQGADVIVIARSRSGLRHLEDLPIRIVRTELADGEPLQSACRTATHIYHCAGCSTDWAPWQTYCDANVIGTQAMLAAARHGSRLERFVHVSTTDVYGYPAVPCDESQPLTDVGLPYNRSKCQGEAAVWTAHREGTVPVTILRPATIFGPRGKAFTTDIALLLKQRGMALFDHGRARGGFCYVDNVADALILAGNSLATLGRAYNITDDTGATWKDYVQALAAGLGLREPWLDLPSRLALPLAGALEWTYTHLPLPGRPILTRHAVQLLSKDQEYPTDRARRDFGLSPAVSWSESLERSIAWLKD